MSDQYIGKIYSGESLLAEKLGEDLEQLYIWMLAEANENNGDIHGEIMDNKTQEVVRKFRKTPIE